MQFLIDKLALFSICFILLILHFHTDTWVIACLVIIIAAAFSYYADNGRTSMIILCIAGLSALIIPCITVMLPVLFYDCTGKKLSLLQKLTACTFLTIPCLFLTDRLPPIFFVMLWIVILLSLLAGMKTHYIEELQKTIRKNRDSDKELQLLLEQKNADLIEKSNYEIEAATLRERNRIAREIHDNVGHLLTRSILQMGALKSINQNPSITPHFEQISDTLNQAMDTIRASVHNLYNPAIDLKASVESFIAGIDKPVIHLHYEAGHLPQTMSLHFIAIIKEAVNNTIRHSNASIIHITVAEHPSFYQLTIEDNGNTAGSNFNPQKKSFSGMGLSSMQERIASLHGTMKIFTTKGFKIFITVMKEI